MAGETLSCSGAASFCSDLLGAVIASIADSPIELDPNIFFLLFLRPLLFLNSWRIPKENLLRDKETILALAIGLVFFTVFGIGVVIHWMIPTMPIAVAFALAAVLSPTDPVALSAITARVPVPKRLMRILEGEALLNDASGLVAMRFAVAAALTGFFSFAEATDTFLWLVIGGISVGAVLTVSVTWVQIRLARKLGEEAGSEILVSLLIPFGAYLLAEHLQSSGILAAVSAGIAMSYVDAIVRALNARLNEVLQSKELTDQLGRRFFMPLGGTPEEFGATIRSDITSWEKIARTAHAKIE